MDKVIKKCLKELLKQPLVSLAPFGQLVAPILCPKDKMCIKAVDDEFFILLPVGKNIDKAYTKAYWQLAELISVLQKLEKENLIYVCPQDSITELICYENSHEIGRRLEWDNMDLVLNGRSVLEGCSFQNSQFSKSLQRFFHAFIFPTPGLQAFVDHNYFLESDYNNWRALKWSRISVCVALFSIIAATLFSNMFGYSTLNDAQYNNLIHEIHISDSVTVSQLKKLITILKNKNDVQGSKVIPRK